MPFVHTVIQKEVTTAITYTHANYISKSLVDPVEFQTFVLLTVFSLSSIVQQAVSIGILVKLTAMMYFHILAGYLLVLGLGLGQ